MWRKISGSNGAAAVAAPLLMQGVRLRYSWQGVPIEKILTGKLDTAACMSAIPLKVAREMKLPSVGDKEGLKSFDETLDLPAYPLFLTELFVSPWGWKIIEVVGCPRDTVLIGRDFCKNMLLLANWQSNGFGICPARIIHRPLRMFFSRLRKQRHN